MTATTFYTLAEVAKNDGKNGTNVWMIIKNNVYDVTNYMDGVSFVNRKKLKKKSNCSISNQKLNISSDHKFVIVNYNTNTVVAVLIIRYASF